MTTASAVSVLDAPSHAFRHAVKVRAKLAPDSPQ